MIRFLPLAGILALVLFLVWPVPTTTAQQVLPQPDLTAPAPISGDEFSVQPEAPVDAVAPTPAEGFNLGAFLNNWLGQLLTGILSIAASFAAAAAGWKQVTAGKVDEALHNQTMQPYTDAAVKLAINTLWRAFGHSPDDLNNAVIKSEFLRSVVGWLARQYPEALKWMGDTFQKQSEYIDALMPSTDAVAALTAPRASAASQGFMGPLPASISPQKRAAMARKARAVSSAKPKAPPAAAVAA